jgi:hypothetical protein
LCTTTRIFRSNQIELQVYYYYYYYYYYIAKAEHVANVSSSAPVTGAIISPKNNLLLPYIYRVITLHLPYIVLSTINWFSPDFPVFSKISSLFPECIRSCLALSFMVFPGIPCFPVFSLLCSFLYFLYFPVFHLFHDFFPVFPWISLVSCCLFLLRLVCYCLVWIL